MLSRDGIAAIWTLHLCAAKAYRDAQIGRLRQLSRLPRLPSESGCDEGTRPSYRGLATVASCPFARLGESDHSPVVVGEVGLFSLPYHGPRAEVPPSVCWTMLPLPR
jgi:hypothetical protein